MEAWAKAQEIGHVKVLTDEHGGSVQMADVKKAIRDLNDLGTVERLIVFFAGHGVNVNRGERWLLSGAPSDPQEAVNVPGSADLARYGGIPYVAMISDACRTAAATIQAQSLTGSEIFPNEENADAELPVDQFFACRLGRPSVEIADPSATTKAYRAIYTEALLTALEGHDPRSTDSRGYVRPRPLKGFLQDEMARRLSHLAPSKVVQLPDAHISSDDSAWLSRVDASRRRPARPTSVPPDSSARRIHLELSHPGLSAPDNVLEDLLDTVLHEDNTDGFASRVHQGRESDEPREVDIAAEVAKAATPFGPTRTRTNCGFKVRGAHVTGVDGATAVEVRQTSERFVHVHTANPDRWAASLEAPRRGGSVLLVLDDKIGVVLPAIPEFIASVTVADGEIAEVTYEPAAATPRWRDFAFEADRVRSLRAVAAASSREGTFALEGEHALAAARDMQYSKSIDPALAVYAAYAYADRGRRDLVEHMWIRMVKDLGGALFDVALLLPRGRAEGGRPYGRHRDPAETTLGIGPLLAQGWALLRASRLEASPLLRELQRTLLPGSLWSAFDRRGIERIREALLSGAVR